MSVDAGESILGAERRGAVTDEEQTRSHRGRRYSILSARGD